MSDNHLDPILAFRVGLLMGELSSRGINAFPVFDDDGFTDEISVRLDEPWTHITLRLKVSLEDE